MINYIYQLIAFIASIVMYCKDDYKYMAIWLAACVIFGLNGCVGDYFYRKFKKEEK